MLSNGLRKECVAALFLAVVFMMACAHSSSVDSVAKLTTFVYDKGPAFSVTYPSAWKEAADNPNTGRTHGSGIDIGHGECPSPEKRSYFIGIDFIVLCLASMNSFHVQGMSQNKWDVVIFTEICYPVPGKHAFNGNAQIILKGFDGLGKGLGISFHVLCNTTWPVESRAQTYMVLACRSIPQ